MRVLAPQELEALLRSSGDLRTGGVADVQTGDAVGGNSEVRFVSVRYTPDASGTLPERLVWKRDTQHGGKGEVGFYRWMAALERRVPWLPRCYSAVYDAASGDSACLLEDVSHTHEAAVRRADVLAGRGVPSQRDLDRIARTLAALHAYGWEHEALGVDFAELRPWIADESAFAAHVARRRLEYGAFLEAVGGTVAGDVKRTCDFILERFPVVWSRHLEPRIGPRKGITLTHGDCYLGQFLVPRRTESDPALVVDFQDVSANLGAFDLVFLLPTFWSPAQRAEGKRERRFLETYHRSLCAEGVRDFPFDALLDDYRLMLAFMVFDAVWNQTDGSSETYWRLKLDCLVGAFRDLGCEELLR